MKLKTKSLVTLMIVLIVLSAGITFAQTADAETMKVPGDLQDFLGNISREYKTEIILGTPLETGNYRIIPVATASFGSLMPVGKDMSKLEHLFGGSIYPVGLVIISPEGAEFVRINRPFVSWIVERIFSGSLSEDPSLGKIVVSALLLVPERIFGISILPRWIHRFFFVLGWYLLALLTTWLFPAFLRKTALSMKRQIFGTVFVGISAFLAIAGLAVLLVLSLVGLPLAIMLVLFYLVFSFAGAVALALLLGWIVGVLCSGKWPVSLVWIIPGGAIFVVFRLIPGLGWVFWICAGLFGFGGALVTLRRRVGI